MPSSWTQVLAFHVDALPPSVSWECLPHGHRMAGDVLGDTCRHIFSFLWSHEPELGCKANTYTSHWRGEWSRRDWPGPSWFLLWVSKEEGRENGFHSSKYSPENTYQFAACQQYLSTISPRIHLLWIWCLNFCQCDGQREHLIVVFLHLPDS